MIVHYASLGQLAGAAARLLVNGNYLASESVEHRRASKVSVAATPGIWFNADGELLTNAPITFEVVPGALEVIVGPGYAAAAERAGEA